MNIDELPFLEKTIEDRRRFNLVMSQFNHNPWEEIALIIIKSLGSN